jgi:endoglucanase
MKFSLLLFFIASILSPQIAAQITAQTAVEKHGRLRVQGNRIVDRNGQNVQLRGMSLYWSQWQGGFYNRNVVQWLRDDWRVTIVRASMAVEEGGYLTDPAAEKAKVKTVVDAAIELGLYVIIDWHDHNANLTANQTAAEGFFEEMAQTYGQYPNILYQIWNEPLDSHPWATVVKPYHEAVIPKIRAHDSLNLIVLGSSNWSSDPDVAALNRVQGANLVYSFHFYAATHKQAYRAKLQTALNRGVAVMMTEWGTSEANGTGTFDTSETRLWWNFADQNQISWLNWSVAALDETSAALQPGASPQGGWSAANLKPSGVFVRNELRSKNPETVSLIRSGNPVISVGKSRTLLRGNLPRVLSEGREVDFLGRGNETFPPVVPLAE